MKGIIIFASNSTVIFHTSPFARDVVDHVVAVVESDIHVKASAAMGLIDADRQRQSALSSSNGLLATTAKRGGNEVQHPATAAQQQQANAAIFRSKSSKRRGPLQRDLNMLPPGAVNVTATRHLGGRRPPLTSAFLERNHKRVVDGVVCLFGSEHAWLDAYHRMTSTSNNSSTSHHAAAASDAHSSAAPSTVADHNGSGMILYWRKVLDRVIVMALDLEESLSLARHATSVLIVLLSEAFRGKVSLPSASSAANVDSVLPTLKEMLGEPEVLQTCCHVVAPQHILSMVSCNAARAMMHQLLGAKR